MSKIEVRLNPDTPPTGTDLSVCNAARRSFNTRSEWASESECPTDPHTGGKIPPYNRLKDKDKRLIEFLARGMTADDFSQFCTEVSVGGSLVVDSFDNESYPKDSHPSLKEELIEKLWQWRNTPTHDTPFNHTFISFEVKAPIFVRAQLVKHEYLILSEFSRRYITDDIEFYEPDYWRKAAENKKQGSLEEAVELHPMSFVVDPLDDHEELNDAALSVYKYLLQQGVAPEQARMVLPQSTMTEWTWSGTLGAFAKACTLRLHPDAQYESKLVMQQVYNYLEEFFPVSAKALVYGPDV